MNQIRRDRTNYNPNNPNNWTSRMYYDDLNRNKQQELQDGLEKSWENIEYKKKLKQDTKDWDIAKRISAATPSENHWDRYSKLVKEEKERREKEKKLFEVMSKRMNADSQSEEEFDQEIKSLREEIRSIGK